MVVLFPSLDDMSNSTEIQVVAELKGTKGSGTSFYMSDGFLYFSYKATLSARYFRCNKFKVGCPGRIIMYSNGTSQVACLHDHAVDTTLDEFVRRADRLSILNQAHNCPLTRVEHVVIDGNLVPVTRTLRPSFIRAQSRNLPSVENLAELNAVLSSQDYSFLTRVDEGDVNVFHGSSVAPDGSHTLLFMSKKCCDFLKIVPLVSVQQISFLPKHLENFEHFEVCVVSGIWANTVTPLAWILLQSLNQEALWTGFQLLRSSINQFTFSRAICVPETSHTFSSVFSVDVYPSLYDFIHGVSLSHDGLLNTNQPPKEISQLCCALPLLPIDRLQVGINFVKSRALQLGVNHDAARRLFSYIEEEWLKIPQNKFTMCGDVDRANYGLELLRNTVHDKLSTCHSDLYSVIRFIISQMLQSNRRVDIFLLGGTIPGPVPFLNEDVVTRLLEQVLKPSFTVELAVANFLTVVSAKLQHLLF